MKKYISITFLFFCFIGISYSQTSLDREIGKIDENGEPYISNQENMDILRGFWKGYMTESGVTEVLVDFKITSGINSRGSETGKVYYIVQGSNESETYKIGTEVFIDLNNNLFFNALGVGSTTVTCTGCSYGCSPEKVGSGYYCSSGCGLNCTKTESKVFTD